MCQEMTAAVWGQMIRTLRLAWKVGTGRIFSSSDFRVCKKFFLYLLQNLKRVIFQDVFLDTSRTLTGKWQNVIWLKCSNPSPNSREHWSFPPGPIFSIFHLHFHRVIACSLLSIRITRNAKWNTDSLRQHQDAISYHIYNTLTPVVMWNLDYCAKSLAYPHWHSISHSSASQWKVERDGGGRSC